MSNFKIGEKVVCIKPIDDLIKMEIYTIKTFRLKGVLIGIHVEELAPKKNELGGWSYYNVNRFRKLDHAFGEKICAEILESVKVKEEQLN